MSTNNYHYLVNKEINILGFLILISFLVRIPIIILYGDTSIEYEWKPLLYNLIENKQLVFQSFDDFLLPNLWMPPLYAYYLYFFSFFNLDELNYIKLILYSQVLLASISIAVFYKINNFFFSKKISLYSSLFFSFFPLHAYACSQVSSISLQIFLTILFFYFFFGLLEKKNILSIILFSLSSGLLILLRGEFWAIFVLSLFYLLFFLKVKLKQILLIFLITLITVSPYLIRNFVIFEKITVLQSFGYNLWKGNHPQAMKDSRVEGTDYSSFHADNTNVSLLPFEKDIKEKIDSIPIDKFYRINTDKIFLDEAIKNIKSEPINHLIFIGKKIVSFLFINIQSMDPRYWNPLHYLPVLIIGITSLIGIGLSDKKSYKFNYLILIFLINVMIFSAVSILPRYKLIILPLQIIFTNVLIDKIIKKFFLEKQNN